MKKFTSLIIVSLLLFPLFSCSLAQENFQKHTPSPVPSPKNAYTYQEKIITIEHHSDLLQGGALSSSIADQLVLIPNNSDAKLATSYSFVNLKSKDASGKYLSLGFFPLTVDKDQNSFSFLDNNGHSVTVISPAFFDKQAMNESQTLPMKIAVQKDPSSPKVFQTVDTRVSEGSSHVPSPSQMPGYKAQEKTFDYFKKNIWINWDSINMLDVFELLDPESAKVTMWKNFYDGSPQEQYTMEAKTLENNVEHEKYFSGIFLQWNWNNPCHLHAYLAYSIWPAFWFQHWGITDDLNTDVDYSFSPQVSVLSFSKNFIYSGSNQGPGASLIFHLYANRKHKMMIKDYTLPISNITDKSFDVSVAALNQFFKTIADTYEDVYGPIRPAFYVSLKSSQSVLTLYYDLYN